MNLHIVPLPVAYMKNAGLFPPEWDGDGNATGYIVLSIRSHGRADYWNGKCWQSYREFRVPLHSTVEHSCVFKWLKDAQKFVEAENKPALSEPADVFATPASSHWIRNAPLGYFAAQRHESVSNFVDRILRLASTEAETQKIEGEPCEKCGIQTIVAVKVEDRWAAWCGCK